MTDTGAYSDVVFGLFRLLGYRFSPRLADIGGTRFGALVPMQTMANQYNRTAAYFPESDYWRIDDYCRWLAPSNWVGFLPGYLRTLRWGSSDTTRTGVGRVWGRIEKTLHALNYIDDEK